MTDVQGWIKKCEALRLHIYVDTTGNPTIGWGRNLRKGLSLDEAELMFQNDYKQAVAELQPYHWFTSQPESVKNALINMNFNMGIGKLLEFKKMIAALAANNYPVAAMEVLNSKWVVQVGQRAKDVAVMIREAK